MSGKYTHTDYNFKTPSTSLLASEPTIDVVGGNSGFELFDYPGEYQATRGTGWRLPSSVCRKRKPFTWLLMARAYAAAFTTGYKFDLTDHYLDSMNSSYVLTEIQHMASVGGTYGIEGAGGESYSNRFTCIPASVPFRPANASPQTLRAGTADGDRYRQEQLQGRQRR